jgi:DNA-binding response OmpR family regulator
MLPGGFGLDLLVELREFTAIPVLVLTARTALDTRVDSFRRGATDFIAKPYFFEELLVRLEARLGDRRRDPPVRFADVEVDLAARRVRVAGEDAGLTRAELDILLYLVSRAGTAVPRERIAEHAIATENDRTERAADVHISRLRRKLGRGADHLCTVRGFGYRLDLQVPSP